jgi:hypothetical protein
MTQMQCLTGASILAPRDNAPKRETSTVRFSGGARNGSLLWCRGSLVPRGNVKAGVNECTGPTLLSANSRELSGLCAHVASMSSVYDVSMENNPD